MHPIKLHKAQNVGAEWLEQSRFHLHMLDWPTSCDDFLWLWLLDGNSCALQRSIVVERWVIAMIIPVLLMCWELAQMTALIELHVWWKHECQISTVGREVLFLCESHLATVKRESYFFGWGWRGVVVWGSFFPSIGDGKCLYKLFYSWMFVGIFVPSWSQSSILRILWCSSTLLART